MKAQRGFSLAEMLIALTITGIIAALLLSLGSQAASVRARLTIRSAQAERAELGASWFRASIEAIHQTDLIESWAHGTPFRMTATTLHSLDSEIGSRAPLTWSIRRDGNGEALIWGDGWVVHRWRGVGARFAYLGADLQWYDSWGVAGDPGDQALVPGKAPSAPRLIRLWFGESGDGRVWVAAPRRTNP